MSALTLTCEIVRDAKAYTSDLEGLGVGDSDTILVVWHNTLGLEDLVPAKSASVSLVAQFRFGELTAEVRHRAGRRGRDRVG